MVAGLNRSSRFSTSELTIVVPTRNERENIHTLLVTIRAALRGLPIEVIIVDDSDDDTMAIIEDALMQTSTQSWKLGAIHRQTKKDREGGLATAVVLGISKASSEYVAVIDADLQHPPEYLWQLYQGAKQQNADFVVATRYRKGGGYEGLDGFSRKFISIGLKTFTRCLFPDQILKVSDPLGGFFLFRRAIIRNITLRPIGYKISLEIMVRAPWTRLTEVPYHFKARAGGESKSDMKQGIMVLQHCLRLIREVPAAAAFWKYLLSGAVGLLATLAFILGLHLQMTTSIKQIATGSLLMGLISSFALSIVFAGEKRQGSMLLRFTNAIVLALIYGIVGGTFTLTLLTFTSLTPLLALTTSFIAAFLALYVPAGFLFLKVLRRHQVTVSNNLPMLQKAPVMAESSRSR